MLGWRVSSQDQGAYPGPDHGLSCMVQADRMSHRIGACARSPSHSRVRTSPSASDGGRRPMSTPPGLVHPRLILPEVAPQRGGSIQNSPAGLTTVHTWRPRHIHTFTYTVRPPGMCGTQSQNHTPLKDTTRGRGELPAGRHTHTHTQTGHKGVHTKEGIGSKTPGGAGTHTGQGTRGAHGSHRDEPHNHSNPPRRTYARQRYR